MTVAARCGACETALVGPYCHACGQASPAATRSLRTALTGQTGKLLYTLRRLLTPGELAREIDRGRDRLAVRPLTLLLNLIPLFFLFGGGVGGFGPSSMITALPGGQAVMAARAEHRGLSVPLYEERVEQRFKAVYSILVVVQALAYGAGLGLLERRRNKTWLVHLATAIHYVCFNFIVSTVLFGVMRLAHASLADHPAVGFVGIAINATYMALSVRRVYEERWAPVIGKTAALMAFGFVVAIALNLTAVVVALWTA